MLRDTTGPGRFSRMSRRNQCFLPVHRLWTLKKEPWRYDGSTTKPEGKTHEIDFCFLPFFHAAFSGRIVNHFERIIVLLQGFWFGWSEHCVGMGVDIIGPLGGGVQIDEVGL